MLTEQCVACGADVPLSSAVHMLVNPKGGEEVTDGYLCRSCYEEHLDPVLPDREDDRPPETDPDAGEGDVADGDSESDVDDDAPESDVADGDSESDVDDDAPAGEA